MTYTKPLPVVDVWSRPFWEACKQNKLVIHRCNQSGEYFYPCSPISPVTRTHDWSWVEVSGRGKIFSFVVMHQLYFKSFTDDIPYLIAQIQLEEGPMLITNLVGMTREEVKMDMPVQVVFTEATDEITMPQFTMIR